MWVIDNSSFSPLHIEHTLFSSDTNLLLRRLLSTNFQEIPFISELLEDSLWHWVFIFYNVTGYGISFKYCGFRLHIVKIRSFIRFGKKKFAHYFFESDPHSLCFYYFYNFYWTYIDLLILSSMFLKLFFHTFQLYYAVLHSKQIIVSYTNFLLSYI